MHAICESGEYFATLVDSEATDQDTVLGLGEQLAQHNTGVSRRAGGPLVTRLRTAASPRGSSPAARASSNNAACCGANPEASSEDNSTAAVSPIAGTAYRTMNAVAALVRRPSRNACAKSARVLVGSAPESIEI